MESVPLGWIDLAMLAVLTLSIVVGLVRGFVFELLSLAGWLAAWIAAQVFGPDVAALLPVGAPGSAANLGAGYALAFVGALIVWSLGARLVRLLIHATPLSLVDRVLGAAFGLLRGGVVLLAITFVVGLTPFEKNPLWRQSQGAIWLNGVIQAIRPFWPGAEPPGRQA